MATSAPMAAIMDSAMSTALFRGLNFKDTCKALARVDTKKVSGPEKVMQRKVCTRQAFRQTLYSVKYVFLMRPEKVIQCKACSRYALRKLLYSATNVFVGVRVFFWFRIVAQNRNNTISNIAKLFPSYLVMCSSNTMLDM